MRKPMQQMALLQRKHSSIMLGVTVSKSTITTLTMASLTPKNSLLMLRLHAKPFVLWCWHPPQIRCCRRLDMRAHQNGPYPCTTTPRQSASPFGLHPLTHVLSLQIFSLTWPKVFASFCMSPNLKHLHPFGCPIYVPHTPLQNCQKLSHWESWARLHVYPGHSPFHATSIGLILSLQLAL